MSFDSFERDLQSAASYNYSPYAAFHTDLRAATSYHYSSYAAFDRALDQVLRDFSSSTYTSSSTSQLVPPRSTSSTNSKSNMISKDAVEKYADMFKKKNNTSSSIDSKTNMISQDSIAKYTDMFKKKNSTS